MLKGITTEINKRLRRKEEIFGLQHLALKCFALLASVFFPEVTSAQWSTADFSYDTDSSVAAVGVAGSGVHQLYVICTNGSVEIYTIGYAAKSGSNRTEALTITVDGQVFSFPSTYRPAEGYWGGPPVPGVVDALKNGNQAIVQPASEQAQSYSLRGSSSNISAALAQCVGTNELESTSVTPQANSLFSEIDNVFASNNCTATEQQLYDAIYAITGYISDAQATVLSWSQDPQFGSKYDVISTNPYTYRWKSGVCAS